MSKSFISSRHNFRETAMTAALRKAGVTDKHFVVRENKIDVLRKDGREYSI